MGGLGWARVTIRSNWNEIASACTGCRDAPLTGTRANAHVLVTNSRHVLPMNADIVPLRSWFDRIAGRQRPTLLPPLTELSLGPVLAVQTAIAPETAAQTPSEAPAHYLFTPPGLTVLAEIDFGEHGNSEGYRLGGWSSQEADFIWGEGQSSEIRLPETQGWSDVLLELDLFPCILPPYRTVQRLHIRSGEQEIGRIDVTTSGIVTIVPPPQLDWASLARLTFIHPDGIVPADFHGRTDGRCLSIAVRRIVFRGRRAPQASDLLDKDMILKFEGLGGTSQGCEFGLVQREFGAEPVGLLRWTGMTAESLAAALEADFEGVGTPEQTILDYFQWPTHREYRTEDRRFLINMHTWVREDEKPYDAMFQMMCRRLAFLRDKLLDDLSRAEKIFVFKMGDRICSNEEIARIHAALRRHGPNTLLYVRIADGAHPGGTVEQVQDGLLIGYISHFNQSPDGEVRPAAFDEWRTICREALRIEGK